MSAVVYADADSILVEDVEVIHMDSEGGSIRIVHGYVLGKGIEVGRHGFGLVSFARLIQSKRDIKGVSCPNKEKTNR